MEDVAGTVYEFSAQLLDGRTASLSEFKGRVLLIVNTASQCGFTPQYAGLERSTSPQRERPRSPWLPLQPIWSAGTRKRRADSRIL